MASAPSRTLMDLFKKPAPAAKRIKLSSSSFKSVSTATAGSDSQYQAELESSSNDNGGSSVTPNQKSRMEFNRLLAKSKRNLKISSERVAKGDNVKLSDLLVEESWLEALPQELEKPYAEKLSKFIESEISSKATAIYPPPQLIFNALNSTPFDSVRAVILGQDPYHGPGQAMGLSFSVPEGIKLPPSLLNIFKELHQDLGCSIPSHGNLHKWTLQGVLLLNAVLTVRNHHANSHAKKGWEQFTDSVIKTISQKKEGVVFLLWGNSAQEKSRLIDETKHHILKAAHPSGLSANRGFFGCRHFSRTNKLLEQMGFRPIDWQL